MQLPTRTELSHVKTGESNDLKQCITCIFVDKSGGQKNASGSSERDHVPQCIRGKAAVFPVLDP